jgi:hypothetical protein
LKELIESGKAALRCEKVWGDEKGLKKAIRRLGGLMLNRRLANYVFIKKSSSVSKG